MEEGGEKEKEREKERLRRGRKEGRKRSAGATVQLPCRETSQNSCSLSAKLRDGAVEENILAGIDELPLDAAAAAVVVVPVSAPRAQ